MMNLSCEYRRADSTDTRYRPAAEAGLTRYSETVSENAVSKVLQVTLKNEAAEDFSGIIHFSLTFPAGNPKFFLPGYLYNRNTADFPSTGRKPFPRVRVNGSMPESDFWMTRADRLAEPVSLVWDGGHVYGIAAAPYWTGSNDSKVPMEPNRPASLYQFSGFTCRMGTGDASVGYTLGWENAPWLFVQTATVVDRTGVDERNSFLLKAGEEVSFRIRIYDYAGEDERAVMEAVRDAYSVWHEPPRSIPGMTVPKAAAMLSGAIRDYAWIEADGMYTGFVYDTPEGFRYNKIHSLTWTNGLAVAAPMLMTANRLRDETARKQSLAFLDRVVRQTGNPDSGLLYDAMDSVRGWWYDGMHSGGHSGYLNGQAVYYILKAWQSEQQCGALHTDWIEFVRPVVDKMNREKNSDGEYPFAFSEKTGAGIEYDSMGSAWCLAATALYALITGEHRYDDGMRRSEAHYHDRFVKKMECYGGPLDTDKAVDSEGVLAYIRATRLMHILFGDECFLDHLKDALDYESTFRLCWNTPVQVRPLSEIGWSSCGGSITSTANPHIHPMSSTILTEMRYLAERTGDSYIESRLNDTISWSLQTFNTRDREYGYGKPGWMSERFCFCQGLLTEKYPDGEPASTWFALMPWASASILEGFADML